MEPSISAKILVRGSKQGWFTGKRLDDYITLQRSNFIGARRIINGTDKAVAIAKIAKSYDKALLAKGYGVDDAQAPKQPTGFAALIAVLFAAFGKGNK
jgi:hypothetical protein